MAALSCAAKQLKDITECPICTDVCKDPRSLPCVHTYCLKCIAGWCKDKRPGDQVACPLCRKEFVIPNNGVNELPKNFFIAKLLMINDLMSNENKTKSCDVCLSRKNGNQQSVKSDAEVFCLECKQNLCNSCFEVHSQLSFSRDHTAVKLDDFSSFDTIYSKYQSTVCDRHKNEPVKIYSYVCKTTVCMMCYVKDHNGHKCTDVEEAAQELRTTLAEDVQIIRNTMNRFDKTLKVLDSTRANFQDQVKKAEDAICKRADELKTKIDVDKQKLMAELNDIKSSRNKQIDNVIHKLAQEQSLLESLNAYCDELTKKGTASELSRQVGNLRTQVAELPNVHNEEETLEKLGSVDVKFLPFNGRTSDYNLIGQVVKDEDFRGLKMGTPTVVHCVSGSNAVGAVALLDSQLFVTRNGLAQVSVYDKTTMQLKRQMSIPGLSVDLYGLTTCTINNSLYVSDFANNCVHRVDLTGSNFLAKWNVAEKPKGLSVNRVCNVLVTCWESKKVQEYTPTGSLVREISDSSGMWQAVELDEKKLLISRTGLEHGIATINVDGQVIQSYGKEAGSGTGQMYNPRCVVVDKRGYFLVAEQSNSRVTVVNPSLTDARTLPLKVDSPLQYACALCLDESLGRLYVGEHGGQKRLLVFDNVFNINRLFD